MASVQSTGHGTLAAKYQKDVPIRGFNRLKRERPTDVQFSKLSLTYDSKQTMFGFLKFQAPISASPSSSAPEIKKLHTSSDVKTSWNDNSTLKLSTRTPTSVLEDCLRCEEAADKQGAFNAMHEFANEHLNVMDTSYQCECASSLVRIAKKSKLISMTDMCLRNLLLILQNSMQKYDVWQAVVSLIVDEERKGLDLFSCTGAYSSLLALFDYVLSEELQDGTPLQQIRCIAEYGIHSNDHNLRVSAINYLVTILVGTQQSPSNEYFWLEKLLAKMTEDRDSRVRITALKGLSVMAKSVRSLSFYMYPLIKKMCENSSKIVRIEALNILKILAERRPETEVKGRNNTKLRLVDDAFVSVCHAINDIDVTVRAEAARMLGDFHQVSDLFLDQTLDKKLLNAMRISKTRDHSYKRRSMSNSRNHYSEASSEWSTGRKLGEDVPAERFDEEQTAIISSGACGAFITALEDEFMIVRQAGVYSLGRLAADRPFLASAALDHLADMFNDEIEQVRLDAVRALTPLVLHGVLQKEQLDTILTVLDDAIPDSREALRILLSKSTLGTADCLRYTVKALLKCMMRFPIDRNSIFKCLSKLGQHHATFVQLLCDEILGLHPVFDITEPVLDDHFYLANLILLLNAASEHDPICSLLPNFALKHYQFLRCSMPELVPPIPKLSHHLNELQTPALTDNKVSFCQHTRALLLNTYEMMQQASLAKSYHQRVVERKLLLRDMEALCRTDKEVADTAQFLLNLLRILSFCDLTFQILSHGGDLNAALKAATEGIELIDRVEGSFSSVDPLMVATLEEFRFELAVLRYAALFDLEPDMNAIEIIELEVESFKKRLETLSVTPSVSVADMLVKIEKSIQTVESKKFFGGFGLFALFQSYSVTLPKEFNSLGSVRIKWVEIVEPSEPPSEPMRFVVGLPLGIPMNMLLHNFNATDADKFRIKVDYPDRSSHLFCPRKGDFTQIDAHTYRLLCKVLVQANIVWSDSARVHLCCVLKVTRVLDTGVSQGYDKSNGALMSRESSISQCIPLVESPFSTQQAAIALPIQPIVAKSSC